MPAFVIAQPPRPSPFSAETPYAALPSPVRLDAHRFANGRQVALLYLPAGERPTEQHGRDLDIATRAI